MPEIDGTMFLTGTATTVFVTVAEEAVSLRVLLPDPREVQEADRTPPPQKAVRIMTKCFNIR